MRPSWAWLLVQAAAHPAPNNGNTSPSRVWIAACCAGLQACSCMHTPWPCGATGSRPAVAQVGSGGALPRHPQRGECWDLCCAPTGWTPAWRCHMRCAGRLGPIGCEQPCVTWHPPDMPCLQRRGRLSVWSISTQPTQGFVAVTPMRGPGASGTQVGAGPAVERRVLRPCRCAATLQPAV